MKNLCGGPKRQRADFLHSFAEKDVPDRAGNHHNKDHQKGLHLKRFVRDLAGFSSNFNKGFCRHLLIV